MPAFTSNMMPSQWPLIQRIRNGIPGPLLAKLTPLWKIYYVLRGSYRQVVGRLHERHGALVQVGPNEYSLSDKGLVYVPKLTRAFFAVDSSALKNLEESTKMANAFRYEPLIEKCNYKFLCLLQNAAEPGEPLELSPLLARYAYETMIVTTTGQSAGFLEESPDANRIQNLLKDWKFYAVLYGSYLKYHPFISKILSKCGLRGKQNDLLSSSATARSDHEASDSTSDFMPDQEGEQRSFLDDDTEARIALTLAGADPAVVLIQTALRYIYSDATLLQQLRGEIRDAQLSNSPLFKELIEKRHEMPLLHAVLLECIRLNPPLETGPTYTTSEEGVEVGGHKMAKDTTISFEPTVAHVNPLWFGDDSSYFQPTRWLDFVSIEDSIELRRRLLAFNLVFDTNTLEEFQILLTCKLLIQVLSTTNMKFSEETFKKLSDDVFMPIEWHGDNSFAMGSDVKHWRLKSLNVAEVFHLCLVASKLKHFTESGCFDVARTNFKGPAKLELNLIKNPLAYAKFKWAFVSMYGDRLQLKHNNSTGSTTVFVPRPKNKANNREVKASAPKPAAENEPRIPRHMRTIKPEKGFNYSKDSNNRSGWAGWSADSEAHEASFSQAEKYEQEKMALLQRQQAAAEARRYALKLPEAKFMKTSDNETCNKEQKASNDSAEPKKTASLAPHLRKKSVDADTTEPKQPAVLPPHLRKKLLNGN